MANRNQNGVFRFVQSQALIQMQAMVALLKLTSNTCALSFWYLGLAVSFACDTAYAFHITFEKEQVRRTGNVCISW